MVNIVEKRTLVRSTTILVIGLFLMCSLIPIMFGSPVVDANTSLSDIRVGLYNSDAAQSASVIALENMFEWMDSTVIRLDGEAVHNGTLDTIDLFVLPAGSSNGYSLELEETGVELIRQFIANGGSFFTLCGGSRFGSEVLRLYEGIWSTDIPGMPDGSALVALTVNQASNGPNLSNEPESYQVYFSGSRCFIPHNPSLIIPIMFYPTNGGVAMFVTRYGTGTVFASGVHAEYEEGSDRDGISAFDFLNDPDSEWDILQKVTEWLIDVAGTPVNMNPFAGAVGIIIGVSVASVTAILGIALFLRHRRHIS